MDPTLWPHAPNPFAPDSQTACYWPWLKVSVALRHVLSFPLPHWEASIRDTACSHIPLWRFESPDSMSRSTL